MKFKADEIASVIQKEIEQFESRIDVRTIIQTPLILTTAKFTTII